MSGITLSAGVRQNLLTLQNTADMMSTTNNRLATGNKVNSAVDNPNSYFTASGLNNRASDLSTLQDSMGLAVQTINAASTGIDAITKLVAQAKSTANQALQASNTATTLTTSVTGTSASTLKISLGGTSAASVSITSGSTVTAIATKITNSTAAAAAGISASVDSSGKLVISAASGDKLDITDTKHTFSAATSSNGVNNTATYVKQYNDLLTQIDQQANDAGFNGVNLLQSGTSLSVSFNESGSSKLDIAGKDVSSGGLNLTTVAQSNWSSAGKVDKSGVNATISKLDAATSTLRAQSTAFGNNLSVVQNRQSFTKSMISTLQTGASNLTLADSNEEAANLLALQTRQSLATTALSISNQANQSITRLF
ncbi:flagellin [Parvibaculum sp.]|uniref:flagellin N-terminal helical domain-containing protein n=1 Tax=Parvibaculum sp. TaxID=2024848 RepID=UPI0032117F1F